MDSVIGYVYLVPNQKNPNKKINSDVSSIHSTIKNLLVRRIRRAKCQKINKKYMPSVGYVCWQICGEPNSLDNVIRFDPAVQYASQEQ